MTITKGETAMTIPIWNEQEQQVHDESNTRIRTDVVLDLHSGILEPHGHALNKQGTPGQDIYSADGKAQKAFTENLGQMRDVCRTLRGLAQPISEPALLHLATRLRFGFHRRKQNIHEFLSGQRPLKIISDRNISVVRPDLLFAGRTSTARGLRWTMSIDAAHGFNR
jgi:hypothetical protein